MDALPAIYTTARNIQIEGHILRRLGKAVWFLENGNPNPYWVNVKRVKIPEVTTLETTPEIQMH